MEITVGFAHSPREVVFHSDASAEELAQTFSAADGHVSIVDSKGQTFVFRSNAIAYVKIGSGQAHPVGFTR